MEGLLCLLNVVMACFMMLMSVESLVDLALATGVMVGVGVHGSSRAGKKDAVP